MSMFDDDPMEKLARIIDNNGIAIRFSDKERSSPILAAAITKGIKDARDEKTVAEGSKADNATVDSKNILDKINKSLKSWMDKNKGNEDKRAKLEEEQQKWWKFSDAQIRRLVETAGQIAFNTASLTYDATKKKFNWLQELETAGIRLAGGFEESFEKLASNARMDKDNFAKMLVTNSKQVAKMNAMGSETMANMMQASGNLVGKFGYNAEEASKIMLHYMDTIGSVNTAEQLRNRNITTEVERLGKQMRYLSQVTGKSVDVLLKEQEQRQKNLLLEKISRDPNMKAFLQMGTSAGISEDVMLAAITGRPNEASSQMNITAGGRALNRALQQISLGIQSGTMDTKGAAQTLAALQKDSRIVNDAQSVQRMSYGKAGALNDTALGNNLMSLSQFMKATINPSENKGEEELLSGWAEVKAAWNDIVNTHLKKMGLDLETIKERLPMVAESLKKVNEWLNWLPDWGYKVLGGLFASAATAGGLKMLFKMKALDLAVGLIKVPFKLLGGTAKMTGWTLKWVGKAAMGFGKWVWNLKPVQTAINTGLLSLKNGAVNLGGWMLKSVKALGSWVQMLWKLNGGAAGALKSFGSVASVGIAVTMASSIVKTVSELVQSGGSVVEDYKKEMKSWVDYIKHPWKSVAIAGSEAGSWIGDKWYEWFGPDYKNMPKPTPLPVSPAQQNNVSYETTPISKATEVNQTLLTDINKNMEKTVKYVSHLQSMDQTSQKSYMNDVMNQNGFMTPIPSNGF